jgi:hypothetical protein
MFGASGIPGFKRLAVSPLARFAVGATRFMILLKRVYVFSILNTMLFPQMVTIVDCCDLFPGLTKVTLPLSSGAGTVLP